MELEEDGGNAQPVSWEILHKHTEAKQNNQGLRQEQHRLFTIYSSNNFLLLLLLSNFSLFCRSSYVLSEEIIVRLYRMKQKLIFWEFLSFHLHIQYTTYTGLHFWHVFKWTTLIFTYIKLAWRQRKQIKQTFAFHEQLHKGSDMIKAAHGHSSIISRSQIGTWSLILQSAFLYGCDRGPLDRWI